MTAQEAYQVVLFWVNEALTGNVSESDFEKAFLAASYDYAALLIGKPQGYRPGAPEPAVQDSMTRRVSLGLSVLRKPKKVIVTKGLGVFDPGDLFHGPNAVSISEHKNACGETVKLPKEVSVTQMNDDEWALRTKSYANIPTLKNPIWRYYSATEIQVLPLDITYLNVVYYKNPPPISVAANTVIKWKNADTMQILYKVLVQLGVNLTDQMALEFGVKMEGSDK